jgi:hypothetical protein
MFEGDFADMCGGKFPLMSMGGPAHTVSEDPIEFHHRIFEHVHKMQLNLYVYCE